MTLLCKPCNYSPVTVDLVDGRCDMCGGEVITIPLLTLEGVANSGKSVNYSMYGYIVMEDGTIHALAKQWMHGAILAILFPDLAKKQGYEPPDEDCNVYEYQRFELDNHDKFPVIRVAFGILTDFSVSKGEQPATEFQIRAMSRIFKDCGKKMQDTIHTDYGEMTVRKFMTKLSEGL